MSKTLFVGFNPINEDNTFTSGDCITGQVKVELERESKIELLCVELIGRAEAKWTEYYGRTAVAFDAKEKFFSIKQFVVDKSKGNSIVGEGCHVYPFTFKIPSQHLPPSFKGSYGRIVYTLEANLSRAGKSDNKAKVQFTLIHDVNLKNDPTLMTPQKGVTEKKMKLLSSGAVSMDANIEQTGFHQGEGIKVVTSIHNNSSRDVKPKYCLYMKCSYFAKGKRKVDTKDILKEVGDAILPSEVQTITRIITVPLDTAASILNCNTIKIEYRLRVYLDVKYASDPEIKFPIVILPAFQRPPGESMAVQPSSGSEASAISNMPGLTSLPQNPTASDPSDPPPSYETYGMYPVLN